MSYPSGILQSLGVFFKRLSFAKREGGFGNASFRRNTRTTGMLSLLLVLAIFSHNAHATCDYDSGAAGTINFSPPSTITVPSSTASGTVLWTSTPITPPTPYLLLDCSNTTNSGIVNTMGGQPSGDDTLFPTNISWLSYRILHPDTSSPLHANPNQAISGNNGGGIQFSVASVLQLVVSGPVTNSGQISGQLGVWQTNYYKQVCIYQIGNYCFQYQRQLGTYPLATFTTSTVRFVTPACTVAVDPTLVTLPTVLTSNFGGKNSTTGQTPFAIKLSCSASSTVAVTLATNTPANGVTGSGVIAPSGTGYAQGVGVQLLDSNANPVTFGTAIPGGTTSNGAYSIPFYARYYQTGASVTGGPVLATATYTLTYQ